MMRTIATLLVLTYALVGIEGGAVMCFERNGHAGYESIGAGHYPVGMAPTNDITPTAEGPKPSHGPCVDPVMSGAQWKTSADVEMLGHHVASPTEAAEVARVPSQVVKYSRRGGWPLPAGLSALLAIDSKTTVLRI